MLLIISPNKKLARSVADTFYYMSILAFPASPHEGLSEVSGIYRAALVINPEGLPDVNDYVRRLKSYRSLPVFSLTNSEPPLYYNDIFDAGFKMPTFTSAIAEMIIDHANKNNCAKIGDYYLAGFDACSKNRGVTYFYDRLDMTRTEAMILRYLIARYPQPVSCKEIVKYAFRQSRAPEPSSVRTHVSLMNKKAESTIGKKIITFVPRRGYIVITPEFNKLFSISK